MLYRVQRRYLYERNLAVDMDAEEQEERAKQLQVRDCEWRLWWKQCTGNRNMSDDLPCTVLIHLLDFAST